MGPSCCLGGPNNPFCISGPWSHSGLCHQSPRQTPRRRVSGDALDHDGSVAFRVASEAGSRRGPGDDLGRRAHAGLP